MLNARGARATGAQAFPTREQLAETDVLILHAQEAGNIDPPDRQNLTSSWRAAAAWSSSTPRRCRAIPTGTSRSSAAPGATAPRAGSRADAPVLHRPREPDHPGHLQLGDGRRDLLRHGHAARRAGARGRLHAEARRRAQHRASSGARWSSPAAASVSASTTSSRRSGPTSARSRAAARRTARWCRCPATCTRTSTGPPTAHCSCAASRGPAGAPTSTCSCGKTNSATRCGTSKTGPCTRPGRPGRSRCIRSSTSRSLPPSRSSAKAMSIDWDERGRLWVAETPEYPNGRRAPNVEPWKETGSLHPTRTERDPEDTIAILTDTNGDGVMDHRHVFADKLELVTGFVLHRNGVIAAAAPDIWYLEDTTGDGVADRRTKLYTGLGTFDTHAVINNLRWGLDGWIYATHGYSTGTVTSPDGSKTFGRAAAASSASSRTAAPSSSTAAAAATPGGSTSPGTARCSGRSRPAARSSSTRSCPSTCSRRAGCRARPPGKA
jgi:uncharacterized protein